VAVGSGITTAGSNSNGGARSVRSRRSIMK
jgi:hypothetical protein